MRRRISLLSRSLVHRFVHLKIGLALVLVWVGIKMLLKVELYYIPTTVSLAVIATILGVAVVASLRATRGQDRRPLAPPAAPPFRTATFQEMSTLEPVLNRRHRVGRHQTSTPSEPAEEPGPKA